MLKIEQLSKNAYSQNKMQKSVQKLDCKKAINILLKHLMT